jgi:hypothetical protein
LLADPMMSSVGMFHQPGVWPNGFIREQVDPPTVQNRCTAIDFRFLTQYRIGLIDNPLYSEVSFLANR